MILKEVEAVESSNPKVAKACRITSVIGILLNLLWTLLFIWGGWQYARLGVYFLLNPSIGLPGFYLFVVTAFPFYLGISWLLSYPIYAWNQIRDLVPIAAVDIQPSKERILLLEFDRNSVCVAPLSLLRIALLLYVLERSRSNNLDPTKQHDKAAPLAPNDTAGHCNARLRQLLFAVAADAENPQEEEQGEKWRYDHFHWRYKTAWPPQPYSWTFLGFMMLDIFKLYGTEREAFILWFFHVYWFGIIGVIGAFFQVWFDDPNDPLWLRLTPGITFPAMLWSLLFICLPDGMYGWLSTRQKVLVGLGGPQCEMELWDYGPNKYSLRSESFI